MLNREREFADVGAHALRDLAHFQTGRREVGQEGAGEDRVRGSLVVGQAVQSRLAGACRKQDEASLRRIDPRQPPRAPDPAPAGPAERVVPAGIEDEQGHSRAAYLELLYQGVDLEGAAGEKELPDRR